ncbi:hypothetical protein GLAREA_06697 [Glarea lozoyensis ATCC 20868]|uniref:2EXR domain-containing protein n=1 Tax=Glarea lozoyensis (strain ATCC 20868 / MF5171) TaxID=1116229 RepID=S3D988_GLAL2|nr:uncharacterized protein GLAREA_06697 [Glarea lozoyensis ATCC 20868]EPE33684.1 hypothetical protein GLAREA_06697 [Glarea lozoyensis ATCC 20868]
MLTVNKGLPRTSNVPGSGQALPTHVLRHRDYRFVRECPREELRSVQSWRRARRTLVMPRPPMRDGEEDMVRRSNESLDAYFARRERSGFKNGVRISGRVGCVSYSMEAFLHWQALRQPMKQETQSTGSLEERNSVKFSRFLQLPTELRCTIWKLAVNCIDPRIVRWHPKAKGNRVPSILHACFESRNEAKKSYHRVVCNDPAYSYASGSGYALFINYDIDVLYLDIVPISARKSGVVEDGSTSLPMEFRDIASTNLDRGQITQLMLSESYLQSATAGDSRPGSYGQTSSLCLKFQKLKSVTIAVDSVVPDPCPDKFSPKMAYDLSNYNWSLTRSCRRDYGRMISAFIVNLEANRRYSPDEIAYLKAEKARVDTVRIVKFNYREPSRSTEYCRRQGPDLVGEAIPVHLGFPWNMNDPPRHR